MHRQSKFMFSDAGLSYANMSHISSIWSVSGSDNESSVYSPMSIPYVGPDPPQLRDEPTRTGTTLHIRGEQSVSTTFAEHINGPPSYSSFDTDSTTTTSSSSTRAKRLPIYTPSGEETTHQCIAS